MLEARCITKYRLDRAENKRIKILDQCSLKLREGRALGLMGKSGCGKSTLAKILLGLLAVDTGDVLFDGVSYRTFHRAQWKNFRKKVQFISQSPETFFDPRLTLETSLREPFIVHGLKQREVWNESIAYYLSLVKLHETVLERYPHQLSGGEIQRLSICRALLLEPEVLILDEPTSMLDLSVQAQILQLLRDLFKERKLTCLFISHDQAVLEWICDEIEYLEDGRICPSI
ncbi:ABC transporter ATP-binding protein [Anaerosinus massiliensis]|uniref:ABC transporter ATP-binding protein n=1 Tax=Massilibacillus massiliensis TaxID=1806837 RepID=UPI000DA62832|nr:dipeptide/oligopeptide/nickel ABC transporter ATP-binding protein [Massilibacillus massiliensis]